MSPDEAMDGATVVVMAPEPITVDPTAGWVTTSAEHMECPDCNIAENDSRPWSGEGSGASASSHERRCSKCGRWLGLAAS